MKGEDKYLYRAIDSTGQTIDFLLTAKRDMAAAKRFLRETVEASGNAMPDSKTRAITPFRMRPAGEDAPDDLSRGWSDGFSPVNQPGGRPFQVRPVALGHVARKGRVPLGGGVARVGGDALAVVKHFNGGRGVAGFQLLPGELIRNAVIVPVDFDVIVDIGTDGFPLRHDVTFGGKRLQGRPVDLLE